MITLIGLKDCNACTMTKNILKNNNIDFEYLLYEDLSQEEQNKYTKMATDNNQLSMPLIIKDNKLITLQDLLNN